jgi:hypothetical protein
MKSIKIELKWALIFTIMSLLWMAIEKATGLHDVNIEQHYIYTNLFAIPSIIIYVLALRDKKYNFYQGQAKYKQLFISGVILSLIIALLAPLSTYVSVEYLSPDYFDNAISMSVKNKMMTQVKAEEYFSTANYMLQNLIAAPVMGIITTLIVSIFLRSKS